MKRRSLAEQHAADFEIRRGPASYRFTLAAHLKPLAEALERALTNNTHVTITIPPRPRANPRVLVALLVESSDVDDFDRAATSSRAPRAAKKRTKPKKAARARRAHK